MVPTAVYNPVDYIDPAGEMGIIARTVIGGAPGAVVGGTGGMVVSGVKIPKAVVNAVNFLAGTIGSAAESRVELQARRFTVLARGLRGCGTDFWLAGVTALLIRQYLYGKQ